MGVRDKNRREFLMLAGTYDESKISKRTGEMMCIDPTGWYMSEKLDGMRCFWDGGITEGLRADEVPWANCAKGGGDHISTGLWTRGGKVIHCPSNHSILMRLPRGTFIDGELVGYDGDERMTLQDIVSVTRSHEKVEEWECIDYMTFDSPPPRQFLKTGRVHIREWETQLPDMYEWAKSRGLSRPHIEAEEPFTTWVNEISHDDDLHALEQVLCESREHLHQYMEEIIKFGGEGVMLRRPGSFWHPRRARQDLQKFKRFYDAEAEITGYTTGKITEKDSRLRGMVGNLRVRELKTGHEFEIAGLNDEERLLPGEASSWAWDNPDEELPAKYESDRFERGDVITFKYWDRTKDGIPKFAQFWREKTYE